MALLEPLLAQPGVRRKPGALLEGAAEVEARQAGVRCERSERYVSIAARAQAFDRAAQRMRRQPTHGRLERGWRAGMRGQQTRGQEIRQLLPEQGIQGRIALQHIRRTHQQAGCDGVGMPRPFQQIAGSEYVGFAGYAFERCARKIELDDVDRAGNIPFRARTRRNDRHNSGTRRSGCQRFPGAPLQALNAREVSHDDVVGHGLDHVMQSPVLPMRDGAIGRV